MALSALLVAAGYAYGEWNGKQLRMFDFERAVEALRAGYNTGAAAEVVGRHILTGVTALQLQRRSPGRDGLVVDQVLRYLHEATQ